jgi:signal transduction histidine kinase
MAGKVIPWKPSESDTTLGLRNCIRGRSAAYIGYALAAILVFVALYLGSRHSYILYHTAIEIFTIVVAAGVFMIGWNTRRVIDNNFLLFIGIAYLFVAGIDILHTLAYHGVFHNQPANVSTQLWLAARYIQAISLVIAPLFLGRKMKAGLVFTGYAAVVTLVLVVIFRWHTIPWSVIGPASPTRFQDVSEYVISSLLVLSIYMLYRKRGVFDRDVFWLLVFSIVLTIASELSFALFKNPSSFMDFVGHVFRLGAFYLIYKAVIETGLKKPVDLLFRDLKASEARLSEANVELEGFAHTVSHDLRGPLSSIAMADAMMKEDAETPVVKEAAPEMMHFIDLIDRNVEQSFSLINDLLALAEAGREPTKVGSVDISELVRGIIEERSGEITKRGISIEEDDDLGTVLANPTQMYQLFSNLIGNAIKYNDSEQPVVEVRHLGDQTDGGHRYLVRDNGSGIPLDVMDNVFVPFAKGKGGDRGIGLATVDRIVRAYGGEIKAYNENGACFEFVIRDLSK